MQKNGKGKQVLLITDMAGYSKVALSAMLPVLTHLGYDLYNLPTALVSNNFAYGEYAFLDTTDYMRDTLRIWQHLGFHFDAVSTGFMTSAEQASLVRAFCQAQRAAGALIFTDPIMGDEGSLYQGLPEETIGFLRELIPVSDFLLPNYTEACLLAGIPYSKEPISMDDAKALIAKLRDQGARSVVVTSMQVEGEGSVVCGYDAKADHHFILPYKLIPLSFSGTGDIFSSVFIGRTMAGFPIRESTQSAMDAVYEMILANKDVANKFDGLQIEASLDIIDQTAPKA